MSTKPRKRQIQENVSTVAVNPRINVIVHMDNKVIKHILYRPSHLVLQSADGGDESLRIGTVNTETTVHFRKPQSGTALLRR